jgi:S1-C subfamily serine protease
LEAGPIANDVGIYVQHPKRGSAATQAGLVRGDVILAVEGGEIESLGDIQSAVRNSQPGEVIQLMVRRHSDALENIKLVYP